MLPSRQSKFYLSAFRELQVRGYMMPFGLGTFGLLNWFAKQASNVYADRFFYRTDELFDGSGSDTATIEIGFPHLNPRPDFIDRKRFRAPLTPGKHLLCKVSVRRRFTARSRLAKLRGYWAALL